MSIQDHLKHILYIVPSDYDALQRKGVAHTVLERDEDGYFDKVYTLHPFAKNNRELCLEQNNQLYEFSLTQLKKANFFKKIHLFFSWFFQVFIFFPIKLKQKRIDFIRSQDPFLCGLIGVWYRLFLKAPLLISKHSDYDLYGKQHYLLESYWLTSVVERFCYRFADRILPIRKSLIKGCLKEKYSAKTSVFRHHVKNAQLNLTDVPKFKWHYQLAGYHQLLCFVGRLSAENHVADLLEAMSIAVKKNHQLRLIICGDGHERALLEEKAKQLNIEQFVIFTGFLTQDQLAVVRYCSSVAVNLVGGYSLLEAAAASLPLIAYDIDWHAEVVIPGETGCLIPYRDIKKLSETVLSLVKDSERCEKMGMHAYQLIEQYYTFDVVMQERAKLYDRIYDERYSYG